MASIGNIRGGGDRLAARNRGKAGRSGIDYATLVGVVGAFVLIATAMIVGGSPGSFVDLPSVLIVFGGTLFVTSASFSWPETGRALLVMVRAIVFNAPGPRQAAFLTLELSEIARKQGMMALQKEFGRIADQVFLVRALQFVVDGTKGEALEGILQQEIRAMSERHLRSAGVIRRAGEVAPAMGLIGTLVGLVQMLGNLENPETIGPSMAVALLTTFYGAVLANMVFLPIANKLERNSSTELLNNQVYSLGVASMSRQENPRRLEVILNTILPPYERVSYFD